MKSSELRSEVSEVQSLLQRLNTFRRFESHFALIVNSRPCSKCGAGAWRSCVDLSRGLGTGAGGRRWHRDREKLAVALSNQFPAHLAHELRMYERGSTDPSHSPEVVREQFRQSGLFQEVKSLGLLPDAVALQDESPKASQAEMT